MVGLRLTRCTCFDLVQAVADEARLTGLDRPAQLEYVAGRLAEIQTGRKPCPLQDACTHYAVASKRQRQLLSLLA